MARTHPSDGVMKSFPVYMKTSEVTVVDLAPDGLDCLPVFGRTHYTKAGGGTVPHVHPGMVEILCCRRGADISFDYGGRMLQFRPGTVVAAQPEIAHFLCRYPKSFTMDWLWFKLPVKPDDAVLGLSADETRWLVARLRGLPPLFRANKDVAASFLRMWRLYSSEALGSTERRFLMRETALRLLVAITESSDGGYAASGDGRLPELIEEMRRNVSHGYTVDELASRAAMSVPMLTEAFKRLTGLPPHQFHMMCRMERAKKELAETRRSVAVIAHSLGIASFRHFSTLFCRETGMSPLAWRKAHTLAAIGGKEAAQ